MLLKYNYFYYPFLAQRECYRNKGMHFSNYVYMEKFFHNKKIIVPFMIMDTYNETSVHETSHTIPQKRMDSAVSFGYQ